MLHYTLTLQENQDQVYKLAQITGGSKSATLFKCLDTAGKSCICENHMEVLCGLLKGVWFQYCILSEYWMVILCELYVAVLSWHYMVVLRGLKQ